MKNSLFKDDKPIDLKDYVGVSERQARWVNRIHRLLVWLLVYVAVAMVLMVVPILFKLVLTVWSIAFF